MAIDPKLVSIKTAGELPVSDPSENANFLFYEGDTLQRSPMSNIYDKVTSGINLGFLTPASAAAPATGIHRGQASEAGTYTNFGGIVVTSAELLANFVYIEVTNGVAKKVLSAKPLPNYNTGTLSPTSTDKAETGKTVSEYIAPLLSKKADFLTVFKESEKNKINPNDILTGVRINNITGEIIPFAGGVVSGKIPAKGGVEYKRTASGVGLERMIFYDAAGTKLKPVDALGAPRASYSVAKTFALFSPATAVSMQIELRVDASDDLWATTYQIEEGGVATAWQAFIPKISESDLKLGNYYKKSEIDTKFTDIHTYETDTDYEKMETYIVLDNGTLQSYGSSTQRTAIVDVENATKITAKFNTTSLHRAYHYADANMNILETVLLNYSTAYNNKDIPIRTDAKYLLLIYLATVPTQVTVEKRITIKKQVQKTNEDISIIDNSISELNKYVYSSINDVESIVIKPEDFEGANLAEKVINANQFIKNIGGNCTLYFGQSSLYVISQAIELPNNTKMIIDNCVIQLADYTFDNIVRSANIIVDPLHPNSYCSSLEYGANIEIIGIGTAEIKQPTVVYRAATPDNTLINPAGTSPNVGVVVDWVGDYWGWRAFGVLLSNVKGFEISGFKFSNNLSWGVVLTNGTSYGSVHDIEFNTLRKNGDGVDCITGVHDVSIYNISGRTYDDTIALASFDLSRWRNTGYIYPLTPVPYNDYTYGSEVYNINIKKVITAGNNHILVILTNSPKIHDIYINDIADTPTANKTGILRIYGTAYGVNYEEGDIYNIFAHDIRGYNVSSETLIINGVPYNSFINKVAKQPAKIGIAVSSGLDLTGKLEVTNIVNL